MTRLPLLIVEMRNVHEGIVDHSMYTQPKCFDSSQADAIRAHLEAIRIAVVRYLECYDDWAAVLTTAALSMDTRTAGRRINMPDGRNHTVPYSDAIASLETHIDGPHGFSAVTRFTHLLGIVTDAYAITSASDSARIGRIVSAVHRMQTIIRDPAAAVYFNDGMQKCVTSLFGNPNKLFVMASSVSMVKDYVTPRQMSVGERIDVRIDGRLEDYLNGPLATASITGGVIDYVTGFVANKDKFAGAIQQVIPVLPKDHEITTYVTFIAYSA